MMNNSFIKINKHLLNLNQYNYWKDGYIKVPLNKRFKKKYLIDNLKNLYIDKEENFYIKKKYKNFNQFDFSSNIKKLDFCAQFIKDSNLINVLNFITCDDLVLSSINIRINQNIKKKKKSFWGQHRDTSILQDQSVKGLVPPSKILIYYPNLEDVMTYENQLKIWPGSHRKIFPSNWDNFFSIFAKKKIIKTDNDNMLLFNGSLMHAISHSNNPKGNLRLIFGFINKHQLHIEFDGYEKIIRWNKILNDN